MVAIEGRARRTSRGSAVALAYFFLLLAGGSASLGFWLGLHASDRQLTLSKSEVAQITYRIDQETQKLQEQNVAAEVLWRQATKCVGRP